MKFKIALAFALLTFSMTVSAQAKYVVKANEAYQSQNYSDAAKKCGDAYNRMKANGRNQIKKKGDMAWKTAECYRLTERYKEANEWYEKAVLLEYYTTIPEVYLYNGDMLVMMGEFEKAKKNYEEYLKLVPESERALAGVATCDGRDDFIINKSRHVIENQAILNKLVFDMAPAIGDRKGNKIYFSSSREGSTGNDRDPRTGEPYMDLWVSELDKKGNWTEPYLVQGQDINTVDNEGTVSFDSRYKKMFFTRCPNMKKKNLGCDIWVADAKGKKAWAVPVKIEGLKTHDSISVGHPCTMDGKYLIFASDRAGGYGGRDLWFTTYNKKAKSWSTPQNMGPEINTSGDELFPTFAINGDLFFASNGRPGLGGLDIYRAARVGEENKWENATNLGSPINSENNDYALIEVEEKNGQMKYGFYTSERKSVSGVYNPDIYSYDLPPNIFDLKVIVSEVEDPSIKIEDVKVVVTDTVTNETWEGYTDANGSVFWDKKPGGGRYINEESVYKINISKEGYHEDKNGSTISTIGLIYDQKFVVDMNLLPKKPINLPEVRYPLSQWVLLVDTAETSLDPINSPDSLQFVFDLLEEYPGMVLELSSHTDSRGSTRANQRLSENRAKACYKFLVEEMGVDPRRIVPVGMGENEPRTIWKRGEAFIMKKPADDNMDGVEEISLTEAYINKFRSDKPMFERLHQMNRRTEGRIVTMDFDPSGAEPADPDHLIFGKYPI
ncbi:MAG: OmpA family protein [Crocinitomicaceae bacterium]|nr:OmpA family protein [Crocinitomicaceae bacterium]